MGLNFLYRRLSPLFFFARRLVRRSFSEGGSLGGGGLVKIAKYDKLNIVIQIKTII
jgi:hypothetical protein